MIRQMMTAVVLVGCTLPATARANAETRLNLRAALTELAKSVKAVVEKDGQSSVRIGIFSPLGLDDSNAGAGISALLAESLVGFADTKATLEVQGVYGLVPDKDNAGIKVIKIKAKVFDTQTLEDKKVFLPLDSVIGANADIAKLLNITGPINPNGSYTERNKEIQKNKEKPSVFIDGTKIKSSKDSPYAIELLIKPYKGYEKLAAVARAAQDQNGQAFVPIDKGEVYEIRIYNYSEQEIASSVTIDGLDSFTFSEDRKEGKKEGPPRFSHFIIDAAKDGKPGQETIVGWHKTVDPHRKDNFLSFLVTDYGQGGASKFPTKSQGKVGVITVSFACSFPEGTARSGSETGFGPPVEVKQEVVKRAIDPPHDFVSVRYLR